MTPTPVIGVVGGGLSGALVKAHLLRFAQSPLRAVMMERREQLGRGIAYSTRDDEHLLNVPMGATRSTACGRP